MFQYFKANNGNQKELSPKGISVPFVEYIYVWISMLMPDTSISIPMYFELGEQTCIGFAATTYVECSTGNILGI